MRWQNQHGAKLEGWQKLYDEGREPPSPFYDRPELDIDLHQVWIAFHDLGSERQIGMGIGPIPWSKIIAYAEFEEIEDIDRFAYLIHALDDEYLKLMNARIKDRKPLAKGKVDRGEPVQEVSPQDVEGTRSVFRNLMLKASEAKRRKPTP